MIDLFPPYRLREGPGVGQFAATGTALALTHPPLTPPASGRGIIGASDGEFA